MANIYSWYQENCYAGNKETMIRVDPWIMDVKLHIVCISIVERAMAL